MMHRPARCPSHAVITAGGRIVANAFQQDLADEDLADLPAEQRIGAATAPAARSASRTTGRTQR